MQINNLHDDEDVSADITDSGILFEKACGGDNIHVIKTGETTAITFGNQGVKNAEHVHTFYDEIQKLIERNHCRILILDMRGVWFLPSWTLGALMSLRRKVEHIELHNVSNELRDSLKITRLDEMFHMPPCEEPQASEISCNEKETFLNTCDVDIGPSHDFDTELLEFDETPLHGKITQISLSKGANSPELGCGVISTPDGYQVYFRADSLKNGEFSKLELGAEVCFQQEVGIDGHQATSIWLEVPRLVA